MDFTVKIVSRNLDTISNFIESETIVISRLLRQRGSAKHLTCVRGSQRATCQVWDESNNEFKWVIGDMWNHVIGEKSK